MFPQLTPEQWGAILGVIGAWLVAWIRGKSDKSAVQVQAPTGPNFAADWADSIKRIAALETQLTESNTRETRLMERIEVLETQVSKQPELERQIRELTASGEKESNEKALMVAANAKLSADLEKTTAERDFFKAQAAVLKSIVAESIDPKHAILREQS